MDTLLLNRHQVASLLTLDDCIGLVEEAFRLYAEGRTLSPGLIHVDCPDGEFHIKAGGVASDKTYFVLKANGSFFHNAARFGLPNIQGLILLSDGDKGTPLAVMDARDITIKRTGAATAVAAKSLARADSSVVTICGAGNQGRIQLEALTRVLPIRKVFVWSRSRAHAESFADSMSQELSIPVTVTEDLQHAIQQSDVCVTCTPSKQFFVHADQVPRGMFIAAVGADSPDKQELDPRLLAGSKVTADVLEQCLQVGELHHAVACGMMTKESVYAELGEIVAGRKPGRTSADEITIFDSTGTALQDAAAAIAVYQSAREQTIGLTFDFAEVAGDV